MYIYFLKNKVNDKIYIGSTSNHEARKKAHFTQLNVRKHQNKNIAKDLTTHTANDFEFIVVSELGNISKLWLLKIEMLWIDYLRTAFSLYNINENTLRFAGKQMVEDTTIMPENRKERLAYRKVRKLEAIKAGSMLTQLCRFKDYQVKNQYEANIAPF